MGSKDPVGQKSSAMALGSIWNREVTKRGKRLALSFFAAAYVVFIATAVWWAHHQGYGMAGYLGFIAIAMVAVWALLWVVLIGIAVADFVKHR